MANHKSALKRVGITAKKNLRNRMITSQVKTAVKSFDAAIASEDKAAIESSYVNAVSTVDKAAAKGVIHKNAANRKKSPLRLFRGRNVIILSVFPRLILSTKMELSI